MCTRSTTRKIVGGAAALCMFFGGAGAVADIPDTVLELTAQVGAAEVTIPIPFDWGDYDPQTQSWSFTLDAPLPFGDLATLSTLDVTVHEDPEVNLNFSVQAGAMDTSFLVASSLLSFPTINSPTGTATAGVTVQDTTGDGATLTKKSTWNGAYLAQYNGWAGDPLNGPQGTTFHEGIISVVAPAFGQNNDATNVGWTPIGVPVSSISSAFAFDVTALDLASGTSHYEVIPEPASLMLIGIGALALVRRR